MIDCFFDLSFSTVVVDAWVDSYEFSIVGLAEVNEFGDTTI